MYDFKKYEFSEEKEILFDLLNNLSINSVKKYNTILFITFIYK